MPWSYRRCKSVIHNLQLLTCETPACVLINQFSKCQAALFFFYLQMVVVACMTQIICFLNWKRLRCSQASLKKRKAEIQRGGRGKWSDCDRNLFYSRIWLPWIGIRPNDGGGGEIRKIELLTKGILWRVNPQIIWGLCFVLKTSHPNNQPDPSKCSQQLALRDKAEVLHSLILIIFEHFELGWTILFFLSHNVYF